jgi:hypothetical protein
MLGFGLLIIGFRHFQFFRGIFQLFCGVFTLALKFAAVTLCKLVWWGNNFQNKCTPGATCCASKEINERTHLVLAICPFISLSVNSSFSFCLSYHRATNGWSCGLRNIRL